METHLSTFQIICIQSGDARSNVRTLPRTVKPGVHRLRLFRSKFAETAGGKAPDLLCIKIYNYGVPEDAYDIGATRPRK